MQLSRYNLEKKVQEQERQLHVQGSSRENYLTQVNQLEQNCLSVSKQASEVTEHMERLQANGRHTKDTFQDHVPYSRKYWQELNLVVEPKITIARILADLNLAVQYRITIRIYESRKFWWILIWRL